MIEITKDTKDTKDSRFSLTLFVVRLAGASVAVEGLALRACTLRFPFSVLPTFSIDPLQHDQGKDSNADRGIGDVGSR